MEHFEEKIQKTKDILSKLNGQDLSLKESLELYKIGIQEIKQAQEMLEKAQLEYEEIKQSSQASETANNETNETKNI